MKMFAKRLITAGLVTSVLLVGVFEVWTQVQARTTPVESLQARDSRGEGRPDNQAGDPYDIYTCAGSHEDQDNVLVEEAWPPVEFFAGLDSTNQVRLDLRINPFWKEFSFMLDSLGSKNPEPAIEAHVAPPAVLPGQTALLQAQANNFQNNQSDLRASWCLEQLDPAFCKIFGIVTTSSGKPEDCSGGISVQSLAAGGSLNGLTRVNRGNVIEKDSVGRPTLTMDCCGLISRKPNKDVNGDGIDDDWQMRYFGVIPDPNDPSFNDPNSLAYKAAPNRDPDGDGYDKNNGGIKKDPVLVPGVAKYSTASITGNGEFDQQCFINKADPERDPRCLIDPNDQQTDPNSDTFNSAPIGNDDAASTRPGVSVSINVLSNDTDFNHDIDPASLHISNSSEPNNNGNSGNPKNGVITSISNGTITYLPATSFEGTEVFYYTICDTTNLCDYFTPVTVTVSTALTSLLHKLIPPAEAAVPAIKTCNQNAQGIYVVGDNCFSNFEEWVWGTNPLDPDTDDDGLPDEADILGVNQLQVPFRWPLNLDLAVLNFRAQIAGNSLKSSFFGNKSNLMKLDSEPVRLYRGQQEPLSVQLQASDRELQLKSNSQEILTATVSSPTIMQEGFLDYTWQMSVDGSDPVDVLDCPGGQGRNQCLVNIRPPSDGTRCQVASTPPAFFCPGQQVEFIVTGRVHTEETIAVGKLPLVTDYGTEATTRIRVDIASDTIAMTATQPDSSGRPRELIADQNNPLIRLASGNAPVTFTVAPSTGSTSQYYFEWLHNDAVDVTQSGIGKTSATFTFSEPKVGDVSSFDSVRVRSVQINSEREFARDEILVRAVPPTLAITKPGGTPLAYGNRALLSAQLQYGDRNVNIRWKVDGASLGEGNTYRLPSLAPGNHRIEAYAVDPYDHRNIVASQDTTVTVADPVTPIQRTQFAIAQVSAFFPATLRAILLFGAAVGIIALALHFIATKVTS